MEKPGLLFDPRHFASEFRAATGDSGAEVKESQPVATLWLEDRTEVSGSEFAWRFGWINFQGNNHDFKISGLSMSKLRASRISATGIVTGLGKLPDFSGNYSAAAARATVAGGGPTIVLGNEHHVTIRLIAPDAGLRFKVSIDGVQVHLTRMQPRRHIDHGWAD
jgi:hypothetical protein